MNKRQTIRAEKLRTTGHHRVSCRLLIWRFENDYTQADAAILLDLSLRKYQRAESLGEYYDFKLSTLGAIASVLDLKSFAKLLKQLSTKELETFQKAEQWRVEYRSR